jgi:L-ribulose-5-phosphate 3-epimerase UlaE
MQSLFDIEIDELTPCLMDSETGKIVKTTVTQLSITSVDCKGWRFDWTKEKSRGCDVYALIVDGIIGTQGLISLKLDHANRAVFGALIEAAPHNVGSKTKKYIGVGPHLVAFGCWIAKEAGYDAFYFDAKTNLIEHYKQTLNAINISDQRMVIIGEAFERMVTAYYEG